MALRHFGHIGGGGFFGMTITLNKPRATQLTVTTTAGRDGDEGTLRRFHQFVSPVPDSGQK
jgi:hypothetical protein